MTSEANASADDRLQRLERKVRRLEVGVAFLVCVLAALSGALVLERTRVPANVSARRFSVVDESGSVVANLARSTGGGVLVLESRSGAEKVILGMVNDAGGLAVVAHDLVRASLMVDEDGSYPSLTMRDREGRTRIMAGLDRVDLPLLSVLNKEAHLDFLVRPGHSPILEVLDDAGVPLLSVGPSAPTARPRASTRTR